MSKAIVEAKNVGKVFGHGPGRVVALASIDLTLAGGTLTMLMGPSGSGKTTLLSILGCMLAPTHGTVRICGDEADGADPESLAAIRRERIGFVFQSYHLFPTLTAAENVQLALDVRDLRGSKARARAAEILDRVGLADKRAAFPRELSGGEQQRVAIARAIIADPAAILADEPTAALDGGTGQAIMSLLADIAHDQERTVLVVTHDTRLLPFADQVIEIEDGAIRREDGATPLLRHRRKSGRHG